MRVAMIGTGYVGLVSGACFADFGHDVTCVDKDTGKIAALARGEVPIYEPGLNDLVAANARAGRLTFTTDLPGAVKAADAVFIAVGTPSRRGDGHADLSYVFDATREIAAALAGFTVVITKSTVPVGTGDEVERLIRETNPSADVEVASNPEFLREGAAIRDLKFPDRIVVGTSDERGRKVLGDVYRPLSLNQAPLMFTARRTAELIKYAANAFLALKISYINEIGRLAERVGADITQVANGIGLDARIGTRFLQAGIGWGGSCFGKDTAALISTAAEYGLTMPIVQAAREINRCQRVRVIEKLLAELKILKGRTIGLLGLAFKPHTDDLREAPAIEIARQLTERGAKVKVHDPVALPRARREYGDSGIAFCEDPVEMAKGADALVLVTEWPQYRDLPWEDLAREMRHPLVLDGRQFLDRPRLTRAGFHYVGIVS